MSKPIDGALTPVRQVPWPWILLATLAVAGLVVGVRHYLGAKPEDPPFVTVARGDIAALTQVSGRIVPREEVFVRSLVAGVLAELHVHPGDVVKRGQALGLVRVVADPVVLSEARGRVKLAQERVARAERELTRIGAIQNGVGLSGQEVARAQDALLEAQTELASAKEREQFVEKGTSQGGGATRSTRILAPIDGTVLAVPVAIGDVIGDTNSYRDGTTIAVIADMDKLLFKGQLEEAHVGKLTLDMPAVVRVGAIEGESALGKLTWIAPRATIESVTPAPAAPGGSAANTITPLTATSNGITRFELWVTLDKPIVGARAGYSATAELTTDRRHQVALIEERALHFGNDQATADVLNADGTRSERELQLGVSDGLEVEVLSGLKPGERVAIPE